MILRTDNIISTNFNAKLTSLDEMKAVDRQEAEQLKSFLTLTNLGGS